MNNTLSSSARTAFIHGLIFLLPFLVLISSKGVGFCSFAFLLAAIFYRRAAMPALRADMDQVRGVLLAFGAVLALAVAGYLLNPYMRLRDIEKPVRMLAAATVMLTVLACRPSRKALWWGLIAGACAGSIYIIWQRWGMGVERPGGMINSITYGDIVLCMGLMCLAGTLDFTGRQVIWPAVGALAGLSGSIATGTRGGWVAIVFSMLLLIQYGDVLRGRLRKGLALLGLALVVGTYFVPQTGVRLRVDQGFSDVQQYFNGGNSYTSMGIRLELWRAALTMIQRHPLLGVSPWESQTELRELVAAGQVRPFVLEVEHFHNDILQALVVGGVVGLAAWASTLLMPFLFFLRQLKRRDPALTAPALAGLLLVISYFSFGLTEVIYWSVRSTMFYALMLFLLVGLCLNARRDAAATAAAADVDAAAAAGAAS